MAKKLSATLGADKKEVVVETKPLTHEQRMEARDKELTKRAATVPTGLKRGWCRFRSKRRCYALGILFEGPDWIVACSAVDALALKGNKHFVLVAGVLPETEMVPVLDEYDDPVIRGGEALMKEVIKDKELIDLSEGNPKVTKAVDPEDEQAQLRAKMGKTIDAGNRPPVFDL